jgi:hypothetical protein
LTGAAFAAQQLGNEGNGTAMEADDRFPRPELSEASRRMLGEAVRRFDPLDRAILEARLGLHGRRRQSLAETTASFGILPTKIRRVEADLIHRLRAAGPGVARDLVEFLTACDRRDAATDAARGILPSASRRRRGARPSAPTAGSTAPAPRGARRRRSPAFPDKEALAPILPGLSRAQILVADELYGLVSGVPADPAVAAVRLSLPEGEVRRIDRLVRRLVAARRTPPPGNVGDGEPAATPADADEPATDGSTADGIGTAPPDPRS